MIKYFLALLLVAQSCYGQFASFADQAFLTQQASVNHHDPATSDWAARVVANGGASPSAATLNALDTLIAGIAADGLTSKVKAWGGISSEDLTAYRTPVVKGTGSDPWVNHSFVGGDLTINGLAGDASSKYLDTGIRDDQLWTDCRTSSGVIIYDYNPTATGVAGGSWVGGGASTVHEMICKFTDNSTILRNGGGSSSVVAASSPGGGWYSSQRTSSVVHKGYFASSGSAHAQIGSTDTGDVFSILISNDNFYVGALNFLDPGPSFYSSDRISLVIFTDGLTLSEDNSLFNRFQTFLQTLGGGYR